MKQARQGDVFIRKIDKINTEGLTEVKRDRKAFVLAYGEVTGHMHALYGEGTALLENEEGTRFLSLEKETTLFHGNYGDTKGTTADHDPITLPAGDYEVRIQKEYDWFKEELRNVAD